MVLVKKLPLIVYVPVMFAVSSLMLLVTILLLPLFRAKSVALYTLCRLVLSILAEKVPFTNLAIDSPAEFRLLVKSDVFEQLTSVKLTSIDTAHILRNFIRILSILVNKLKFITLFNLCKLVISSLDS